LTGNSKNADSAKTSFQAATNATMKKSSINLFARNATTVFSQLSTDLDVQDAKTTGKSMMKRKENVCHVQSISHSVADARLKKENSSVTNA